jgi:Fe-S cluster assembly protein SufD
MSVAEKIAPSEIVKSIRAKATLFLESTPFPSNRDEEWRFTSLRKYISGALSFAPIENKTEPTLPPFYHQCEGTKIVLHNGIFDEKKSVVLDDSFTINKSEEALQKLESALVSPNYFTAYNTAHFQYGLTLEIAGTPKMPINIFHIVDNENAVLPRLLVNSKKNSSATINELYFDNTAAAKVVAVTEVFVENNAGLNFNSVVVNNPNLALINTLEAHCERDARFYHASYISESKFVRNNIHARLDAENSYASLSGFYSTAGENLADNHVLIDHLNYLYFLPHPTFLLHLLTIDIYW